MPSASSTKPGGLESVTQVVRIGDIVEPSESISEISEDPADDQVLEAALAGGAQAIVSGDRHLLRLKSWRGTAILTLAELLAGLASDSSRASI